MYSKIANKRRNGEGSESGLSQENVDHDPTSQDYDEGTQHQDYQSDGDIPYQSYYSAAFEQAKNVKDVDEDSEDEREYEYNDDTHLDGIREQDNRTTHLLGQKRRLTQSPSQMDPQPKNARKSVNFKLIKSNVAPESLVSDEEEIDEEEENPVVTHRSQIGQSQRTHISNEKQAGHEEESPVNENVQSDQSEGSPVSRRSLSNQRGRVVVESEHHSRQSGEIDLENAFRIMEQAANQMVQNSLAITNLLTTAVLLTFVPKNTEHRH